MKKYNEQTKSGFNNHGVIDFIYFSLGAFTHIYGIALTLAFFTGITSSWPLLVGILQIMRDSYWVGLGVYVLLKETRKRRYNIESRHWGELIVFLWAVLFLVSTAFVIISPRYNFDDIYKLIATSSIITVLIYAGSRINKF